MNKVSTLFVLGRCSIWPGVSESCQRLKFEKYICLFVSFFLTLYITENHFTVRVYVNVEFPAIISREIICLYWLQFLEILSFKNYVLLETKKINIIYILHNTILFKKKIYKIIKIIYKCNTAAYIRFLLTNTGQYIIGTCVRFRYI